MTHIVIDREVDVSQSSRTRQLEAIFDVPHAERSHMHWEGDIDLGEDWQIGLVVGPSGSGKTTLVSEIFDTPKTLEWGKGSVVDDFAATIPLSEIADVCQAVGFNTIPAWMRPFSVLSNGEQFRVTLARLLLEQDPGEILVVDEFTSVVDRQVAKIGSHAVQKWIREHPGRQIVAASCHYDIIDWLQPDWILEMPTMTLERRSVQRRPELHVSISRVPYSAWHLFAPFHYLTKDLNTAAKCFCLFVHGEDGTIRPASFTATLHRPHAHADDIEGGSRIVTLPDWQGLGLAFALSDTIASAFAGIGKRYRSYPAHPAFIRSRDKSPNWKLIKKPGSYSPRMGTTNTIIGKFGGRPCAVFEYIGPKMERDAAQKLIYSDYVK